MTALLCFRVASGLATIFWLFALWGGAMDTGDDTGPRFITGLLLSALAFGCGWFAITGHFPQ